jgi:hypothetical protein
VGDGARDDGRIPENGAVVESGGPDQACATPGVDQALSVGDGNVAVVAVVKDEQGRHVHLAGEPFGSDPLESDVEAAFDPTLETTRDLRAETDRVAEDGGEVIHPGGR